MSALPPIIEGRRRWQLAALVAFALGQAAAAGLVAFATRDVFASFREGGDIPLVSLAAIVVAAVSIAALRYSERVVAERLGQDYAAALRLKIFLHLSRVSVRKLGERRVGQLSMRFVGDLSAVRGWISLGLARLVSAAIVLPATVLVLFLLNADLAIAAAIPLVVGIGVMAMVGPRLSDTHRQLRTRRAKLAADMTERVVHAPELRLLGRMQIERRHLTSRTRSMMHSAIERARGIALLRVVPDVLTGVAAASVFFAAFVNGVSGAEAAGALAAVALAVQQLRDIAGVWDRNRAWVVARDKCLNLLMTPTLPQPLLNADDAVADRPPVLRFMGVDAPGLQTIDAEASAGRKIAVVGANGAGKSTLLALAAGLEHPTNGRVTLDGRDIFSLRARERRRLIAYLSGRSPILAGSLRRALTMGAPERPSDATIEACAEAFGLGPVLDRVGGLDGVVAEAGRNLSSGEARRLLLARVALSHPRLILLDEPDDALDPAARSLVEDVVLGTDATALIITHDLSLARKLDEVWLLHAGTLIVKGTPDEVLSGDGPVARHFSEKPIREP
ncbi:MAG: ABC transporter ATP-binding protein [Pseudomonadota bacterium]